LTYWMVRPKTLLKSCAYWAIVSDPRVFREPKDREAGCRSRIRLARLPG
jgi:hypothetical protein